MGYSGTRPAARTLAAACLSVLLAACSGSNDSLEGISAGLSLAGSVGDGPIVGAELRVYAGNGDLLLEAESDSTAAYAIDVPDGAPMPITVVAEGGTDLVTGRGAEFPLRAMVFRSGPQTVNLSPYTTLALAIAECRAELTPGGLERAWQVLDDNLNLGWRTDLIVDPMAVPVDAANAATVLLANEALGELLRRLEAALAGTSDAVDQTELVTSLACDLADGALDGSAGNTRRSMAALTALAAVQLEVLAGMLHVDGQPAMALMESALRAVAPGSAELRALDLPEALLLQTGTTLAAIRGFVDEPAVLEAELAVAGVDGQAVRAAAQAELAGGRREIFAGLVTAQALADDAALDAAAARAAQASQAKAPMLSLSAEPAVATSGEPVRLSWASGDAELCLAEGAWEGERPLEGSETVELRDGAAFTLSCAGLGGVASRTVVLAASGSEEAPVPAAPAVNLEVSADSVDAGASAILSWTAANADSCMASGAWSGPRPTRGSETTAALQATTTFSLTCAGSGGSASDAVTITVTPAPAALPEPPPEEPATAEPPVSEEPPPPEQEPPVAPAPEPTLSFTIDDAQVDAGTGTTLRWSASDADSCTATGAWSGARGTAGSAATGALAAESTYSLSCSGAGGNVVAMLRVAVLSELTLNWQAPTQNVDGSTLDDLAGYRIYYGASSGSYRETLEVADPQASSLALALSSGTYYVVMTALDADGNESGYSNEIVKLAP